jgi:hypothetical protein
MRSIIGGARAASGDQSKRADAECMGRGGPSQPIEVRDHASSI